MGEGQWKEEEESVEERGEEHNDAGGEQDQNGVERSEIKALECRTVGANATLWIKFLDPPPPRHEFLPTPS